MSRIGKKPVSIPGGVTVAVAGHVVEVSGPKGKLSTAFRPEISFQVNGQRIAVAESGSPHATSQETNLFRHFADQIQRGGLNDAWPEIALQTQQVVNACSASAENGGQPVAIE